MFCFGFFLVRLRGKGHLHLPLQQQLQAARVERVEIKNTAVNLLRFLVRCLPCFTWWKINELRDDSYHFTTAKISRDCFKQLYISTFKMLLVVIILFPDFSMSNYLFILTEFFLLNNTYVNCNTMFIATYSFCFCILDVFILESELLQLVKRFFSSSSATSVNER